MLPSFLRYGAYHGCHCFMCSASGKAGLNFSSLKPTVGKASLSRSHEVGRQRRISDEASLIFPQPGRIRSARSGEIVRQSTGTPFPGSHVWNGRIPSPCRNGPIRLLVWSIRYKCKSGSSTPRNAIASAHVCFFLQCVHAQLLHRATLNIKDSRTI